MSEIVERRKAVGPDPVDEPAEAVGLVNRVSAGGFQVSQAMEGLDQVAGLLRAAGELAKDADARRREAEDEAAFAESQAREIGQLLAMARSDTADAERRVADAEARATQAEDRLQQALERAFGLEAELEEAGGRVPAAKTPRRVTFIVDDRRDELRDAFAAEIRRPLDSIMALALKHAHATTGGDGTRMIRQLGANGRRLERLVAQILELDGIANGSYTPNKRRADLKTIVRRVVGEMHDVDGLDVRVHAEHAALELDPALTEQMVETLLSNAARRSESGGPVWVRVTSDHTGALIAVDDTGADVPAGAVGAGPDDGLAARRRKARGATSLSLLSRLAELHGGRAWVQERPGGGASFRVFLPTGTAEPSLEAGDEPDGAEPLQDDHDRVVFDTASVRSSDETVDERAADPSPYDAPASSRASTT